MQSAKDSFYVMLRGRVAEINPERTVNVRGVSRPGVLVAENELPTVVFGPDTFWLRWSALSTDGADGLVRLECEVVYATDGAGENGGMDRGRMLAGMDLELSTALRREPQNTGKILYTGGGATAMLTNVFWTDPVFGKAAVNGERLSRTATVSVFAYDEGGEL